MRNTHGFAIALLAFACSSALGAPMSKEDYQAAKKRITAQYDAERQKCGPRHANALDLCVAHAHGERDVALAELEATYKPSPRANYNAAIARSKAAYNIANQECDDKRGAQKTACVKAAKESRARAQAEAQAALTAARAEEAAKPR